MKGLLLKDWYMMIKYMKLHLLVCIIFLAVSVFGNGNRFFEVYTMMLSGIIPISLNSYDERSGWIQYSNTLPYSRAQLVSAKYIISFLIWAAVAVCTLAVQGIRAYTGGVATDVAYSMLIIGVGLIPSSLMLPFVFRFGSEKGRIAYVACIAIICGIMPFLSMEGMSVVNAADGIRLAADLVLPAVMLMFAVSWLLSVKFFKDRELS